MPGWYTPTARAAFQNYILAHVISFLQTQLHGLLDKELFQV